MKTVIITGASKGIGNALAKLLVANDYYVIGIGRDFEEENIPNFEKIIYDLTNVSGLEELVKTIQKNHTIDILINNAGCAYYGAHETLTPAKINEMTTVNLTVPMILSNLLLKDMKTNGGCIVNISSVTAKGINTHGCAYGATKAGLSSFGASLFEEARKAGVKVLNIHPDMTDTSLYRNADFTVDEDEYAHLTAEDVAETIFYALKMPERMLLSDITLKPQKHKIHKKTI